MHAVLQSLTQKECEALIPDPGARTAAINFLLGTVRFEVGQVAFNEAKDARVGVGSSAGDERHQRHIVFPRGCEEGT